MELPNDFSPIDIEKPAARKRQPSINDYFQEIRLKLPLNSTTTRKILNETKLTLLEITFYFIFLKNVIQQQNISNFLPVINFLSYFNYYSIIR